MVMKPKGQMYVDYSVCVCGYVTANSLSADDVLDGWSTQKAAMTRILGYRGTRAPISGDDIAGYKLRPIYITRYLYKQHLTRHVI